MALLACLMDGMSADMTGNERLDHMEKLLKRLVEESEEACEQRNAETLAPKGGVHVPSWVWTLLISSAVTISGAIYVTGQFNGKFEEFRMAVYQRLDRLERTTDAERHRAPDNYTSPPIVGKMPR